jgi:phospholipid/cholesterol/gamma-HCH transport system substrate-binding protein
MVRPVIRDFMTGFFTLLALFGLILMLLLFGEISDLGEKYYTFVVHVTNAGGLSGTSAVTLNGVKVGQVLETSVVPPPGLGANLKIKIKEKVAIPKVAKVTIERSFVGDAGMEFTIPPDAPATAMNDLIKPGETFEGGAPESTIGRLASAIEKPLSRFSATADNIDKLATTYNTLGERLNELLEPRTPADVAAGKTPNIRSTIARADQALDNATKFLSDEQLVKDTKNLIAKANEVMDQAHELAGAWSKTAENVDKQATRVGDSVDGLAQQAAGALRTTDKAASELAELLEKASSGNGTVGQLMNNPDLYNNLRDAAQRLDRALADFQLLIQKYRTEGIPLHL